MTTDHNADRDAFYAERVMTWYGWGSPVGLGLFVVSLGAFILLLSHAGIWR